MKRIAFISPFTNTTNRYIDLQKQILSDCGFEVRPLSIKSIFKGQAMGIMSKKNLMLFHWLETRPFRWRGAHPEISITRLIEFSVYIFLMAIARAKIVYFIHDHAVHDTTGWKNKLSVGLISLLKSMADLRVVHDPSFCEPYKAEYLPHPLYWDDWGLSTPRKPSSTTSRQYKFGMLGAVRPYKSIHSILQHWPSNISLTIRGRSTEEYTNEIKSIIQNRGLAEAIDFQPRFLKEEEFIESLSAIDALILGHADKSMLVSGALFEAVGRVPMIYARRTSFMTWVSKKLPGIILFDSEQDLIQLISKTGRIIQTAETEDKAIELFGRRTCMQQYGSAFNI
jgi:beta-1,4-mannosyltransferase